MKYLFVLCLFMSVAHAKTVDVVYETGGFSSICTINDETIDYHRAVSELRINAESQCQGSARRVSQLVMKTECKDLHVWGAVGMTITFKARYECF